MTAIFYSDCEGTSDGGRFTLEARSPHNGTIRHRDGRKVSEDEFSFKYRQDQSEFRYQLLDNAHSRSFVRLLRRDARRVVWERWQGPREDSPAELVVSDDGWAVIRTHGFRPEVIAVALDGRDILRVRITGEGSEHDDSAPTPSVFHWDPEHLVLSTAGLYWTAHSWRDFFQHGGIPYFVWRTCWGQRLVIDLGHAVAFTDEQHWPAGVAAAVVGAEKRGVMALLSGLSRRMDEVRFLLTRRKNGEGDDRHPMLERVRQVAAALHLVGVHQLPAGVPFLREWERIDFPSSSMGSTAMPGPWWLETQYFRPIVHHSLKLLGEEPVGFPTYHFTSTEDNDYRRLPMPERLPDRRNRAGQVDREMSAQTVLELLGSPDFIQRRSEQKGQRYLWFEDWEFDFRAGDTWVTLRIRWEERNGQVQMMSIDEVPPYWLQLDEREQTYLWR
jgi:hypothetical protein